MIFRQSDKVGVGVIWHYFPFYSSIIENVYV
jgi:hypothetical protein